jgi:hypothetical protein
MSVSSNRKSREFINELLILSKLWIGSLQNHKKEKTPNQLRLEAEEIKVNRLFNKPLDKVHNRQPSGHHQREVPENFCPLIITFDRNIFVLGHSLIVRS